MSIIGLDGKPMSTIKEAVAGENLIECLLELSDPDNLKNAKPINIHTNKGVMPMSPEKLLPDLLGNLYQFMLSSGQKQLMLTITDKSLPTIKDKRFNLKIQSKSLDNGKDYDLYVMINKWYQDYSEHKNEKYYADVPNFDRVLCDMLGINEEQANVLINKYIEHDNVSNPKV